MASKILCTLNPHACNSGLTLSQSNCVVVTNAVQTFNRMVFGTLAMATGTLAFECQFFSVSNPTLGLANLCSVGVAHVAADYNSNYCGQAVPVGGIIQSVGLRPSNGTGSSTGAGIYTSNALSGSAFNQVAERQVLGVFVNLNLGTPLVAFHVNGSYIGQVALTPGAFYVPAVSLGSTVTPNDVAAYLNFGQTRLIYPNMQVSA